jgi:hypothetical protein
MDVPSVGVVTKLFGEEKGLLVCRPTRYLRPWFSVPEGCYALVTEWGKDMNHPSGSPVWPAGFHFGAPWVKVANVVSKQSVVFNMPIKGCKTQDNVTVQINLSLVFRIMGDETCAHRPSRAPPPAPLLPPRRWSHSPLPSLACAPLLSGAAARARTRRWCVTLCTR